MFSPLIMMMGQIQQAGLEKLYLPNINLGVPPTILVSGPTITKTTSVVNLLKSTPGGSIDLLTINGGEEGDYLIVFGDNVKLKRTGNISMPSDFTLEPDRCIVLFFWNGVWNQVSRSS